MSNENIPLPVLDIIRNISDKKKYLYRRLPYRTRLMAIKKVIDEALNKYDNEYTQKAGGKK